LTETSTTAETLWDIPQTPPYTCGETPRWVQPCWSSWCWRTRWVERTAWSMLPVAARHTHTQLPRGSANNLVYSFRSIRF